MKSKLIQPNHLKDYFRLASELLLSFGLPIGIGIICFLMVAGHEILNPKFVNWIHGSDPLKDYIGWAFYRNGPWTFPVGLNPKYGMEISSSILYSDSIPIMAIFFKLLSPYLSTPFQYLGLWTLFCFVLQAFLGYKLCGLITENIALRICGSIFFLFSPPFFNRIGLHAALTGQFLILWALYLSLKNSNNSSAATWIGLVCISALVHMYLLLMVLGIWLGNLLDQLLFKNTLKIKRATKNTSLLIACLLLTLWEVGFFSFSPSDSSFNKGDFGFFRMNLLSVFDPSGYENNNWSYIFTLPNVRANGNQEGANYLGLGILLLLPFALYQSTKNFTLTLTAIKRHPFLLLNIFVLAIFSLSNNIGIGSLNYTLDLPDNFLHYANLLRASGRFFWPFFYLIIFSSLYIIIKTSKTRLTFLLVVSATCIQIVDTSAGWLHIKSELSSKNQINRELRLQHKFWDDAGRLYKNIKVNPVVNNVRQPNWEIFAPYAIKHNMATNFILVARISGKQVDTANSNWQLQAQSNTLDKQTLYVLDEKSVNQLIQSIDLQKDLLARIDGINIYAPNWKTCSGCPSVDSSYEINSPIKSSIQLGDVIYFGLLEIGQQYLGTGWPIPEPWGTWSSGTNAKIDLPLPDRHANRLILNVRAFVNDKNPQQIVKVRINNQSRTILALTNFENNKIDIPLHAADWNNHAIKVELEFQNSISPKSLGISNDDRVLAIGLISARYE